MIECVSLWPVIETLMPQVPTLCSFGRGKHAYHSEVPPLICKTLIELTDMDIDYFLLTVCQNQVQGIGWYRGLLINWRLGQARKATWSKLPLHHEGPSASCTPTMSASASFKKSAIWRRLILVLSLLTSIWFRLVTRPWAIFRLISVSVSRIWSWTGWSVCCTVTEVIR